MLIGDDDDGLAEDLEVEAWEEQKHAALEAEPEDTEPEGGSTALSRESVVLLPFVSRLVSEHRRGGASAGDAVVAELKRVVSRAKRMVASLDASDAPMDVASVVQTIQKRTRLLSQHMHNGSNEEQPSRATPQAQDAAGA
jgi:hypothetical protein